MNLYIASIKLWFKGFKENTERSITYSFEPNKINVITGDSSTGKSSILDIIDYLLLSDNPTIVENIINENVEFYGMNIFLEERSYILMRKAPHSGQGTQDVYWKEQEEYPMPYIQTHSVGEMRTILTRMFYVPQHETKVGNRKYNMTFRHFLPFNYLTEDIISSANTYFDTAFFINRSYDVFLDYALELVNGIQYHNANEIKAKIEKAEIDLKQYQKKHQIAQENATKYKASLTSIYDDALSLNLIPADNFFVRENAHEMLHYIKEALAAYNKLIKNDEDTKKLELLKKERYELNNKLSIYNSLLAEMQKQKSSGKKIQDSLRPITFIKEHIDEVIISPETIELLHLLEKQLVQIKESRKEKPKLPHDFALRHEELKDKLKDSNKKDFHLILLDRQTRENTKLDITQFFQSYLNCDIIKEDSDFTKEFYDKTREFFNDNGLIGKYDRIRKLLEERENININSVADELFEEDEEIKGKYKEFIFKTVHNDDFEIDKSWVEENFKKRVLKTSDNSITIVINGNQLEDKNKIIIKKTDDNDKKVDLTIKNVILEDKR